MNKGLLFSFFFAFLIFTVSLSAFAASEANENTEALSHGILVLAEESPMAMSGRYGTSLCFAADDFARAMNLSHIGSITITELPPISDGELLLGSTVLCEGQTISANNLGHLKYDHKSPTSSASSFRFSIDESAYDLKCSLYMLDRLNLAPTLSVATETALEVSTHKNIMLYGILPCYDPDGDNVKIEIVSYPENGSIMLTDKEKGEYTYLPDANFTGKDSFSYVAVDTYGSYSASKTVSLEVNAPKTSVVYADMLNSKAYNSALTVTEKGIMSGSSVGEISYFYPERTVSRAEFVVMAMKAVGIEEVADADGTVFFDNADIPRELRGFIKTAYELGYINGRYTDGSLCFCPNEAITRAEAAVIVCNMIDATAPTITPVFDDSDEIPAFAASAVNSLGYMGILQPKDGNISASSPMTREATAHLLSSVVNMVE